MSGLTQDCFNYNGGFDLNIREKGDTEDTIIRVNLSSQQRSIVHPYLVDGMGIVVQGKLILDEQDIHIEASDINIITT